MIDDANFWAAGSAVLVAFISGIAAPYVAARYKQRTRGSPTERVRVASQAGFGNGTARMAIRLASDAQDAADEAKEETDKVIEKNRLLLSENEQLRGRVTNLEAENRDLRQQVRSHRKRSK